MTEIKTGAMRHVEHHADLCIVGGGLSGLCAALAAAREGTKVVLMQDRPVLGGNASSEIRMWVRGAKGKQNRETGIISELEEENIYRNPSLVYSNWDSVMWGKVHEEKNIELLLNCSCVDADMSEDGKKVVAVKGWQLTTYTWHTVYAKYFADCSGDSVLAPVTGALYRVGREGHDEFGESIGPAVADKKTMGMSCLMQARETDHYVPFIAPEWAHVYENDEDFDCGMSESGSKAVDKTDAIGSAQAEKARACTRTHTLGTSGTNFWWMELGGEHDSIHDTETLRDELLKIAYGIWDHIKNRGDHGADNWELEWVGFLPGKRESRRYVGAHVLTQSDVEAKGRFEDIVAYGGWSMDDHHPGGFYSPKDQSPTLFHPAPSPYGIPYRCLYSKNIENLFFAGRNISVTHAALSSTRVMATCALLGQAMGTAASICVAKDLTPNDVYEKEIPTLQKKLRDAGCYIPFSTREIPALTKKARINLSEKETELLFNGKERPSKGEEKSLTKEYVRLPIGSSIRYTFDEPTHVDRLRIYFDPDFSRESVSINKKMRVFAQKCSTGLDFEPMKVAKTLVKTFAVLVDGKEVYSTDKNHNALFRLPLGVEAREIEVRFDETWGSKTAHIFSCDVE